MKIYLLTYAPMRQVYVSKLRVSAAYVTKIRCSETVKYWPFIVNE